MLIPNSLKNKNENKHNKARKAQLTHAKNLGGLMQSYSPQQTHTGSSNVKMSTVTQTETSKVKNKEQQLGEATSSKNLDEVLRKVKKVDNTCAFIKCKNLTSNFAIECKHCKRRFCTTHGLPEIHGCGEAAKKDERSKYLHPNVKLSGEKHSQAETKLHIKLRQMQQERKSKQGFTSKGKKK